MPKAGAAPTKKVTAIKKFSLIWLVLPILPVLAVAGFEIYYQDRVFAGVRANGAEVGGLNLQTAINKIASSPSPTPSLKVWAAQKEVILEANTLGWKPDPTATAKAAWAIGRNGNLSQKISEQWNALSGKTDVARRALVDKNKLKQELLVLATSLDKPAKNAEIFRNDKNTGFEIKSDANGIKFDVDAAVKNYVENPNLTELQLQSKIVPAQITANVLQANVVAANALVRSFQITYPQPPIDPIGAEPVNSGQVNSEKTNSEQLNSAKPKNVKPIAQITLNKSEVYGLLKVSRQAVSLEPKALSALLNRLQYFNLAAHGARYVRVGGVNGTELQVKPSQTGWKMDRSKAATLIKEKILMVNSDAEIILPVIAAQPGLDLEELPKQTDLQLVSEVTTYYPGSPKERIYNVSVAASKIDGYVVGAGEEFNFNNALGNIGTETGFAEALVISNGRTVKGVGGGVCQSSTTTFRALYKLGLPVVERNQHAYKVHWYEPFVGFDAAVYQPTVNMRMQNDTTGPLMVRAKTSGASMTVQIYGVPDGRKVFVSEPSILWRIPNGPPIYEFDRFKRYGAIEQVDWAVEGMGVRRYRTVTLATGEKRNDVLFSNYKPWRAVYKIGPGVRGFASRPLARRASRR